MSEALNNTRQVWRVKYRILFSMAAHFVLFVLALLAAFCLRHDFKRFDEWFVPQFLAYLPITLAVKMTVFGVMGLYRDSWRYVGLRDLFSIFVAVHVSEFICLFITWIIRVADAYQPFLPEGVLTVTEGVFLLDWVSTIAFVSLARIGLRFYNEELRPLNSASRLRLLIVGAGDVGDTVLREIVRTSEDRYQVVGFVDDDPINQKRRIRGIDVLGTTTEIKEVCVSEDVDEVLIALPDAPQRQIRAMVELCQGMNLQFRTIPAVRDLIEGNVEVSQLRPVDIEDLLGRDPVKLDDRAIEEYIRDKVVMVTGAGGSIGAEMCRQIARFRPGRLLLVERMENALFEIDRELRRLFPDLARVPLVADIGDRQRILEILRRERPAALFHAAAHKHVPMMEYNPGEALKNNIQGTKVLADAACEAGVSKFVMISTDKAVNPTSIMGCTKRVAEMYVQQLAQHVKAATEFVTVRFGNVLGSSGSVVPIFKEQIAAGGPVTVTHPEMTRYFMTIPEASQLVLQAGAMGEGGEIFLLDMGEPVKILQLARDLITLSGLRPNEDIEIQFCGIRPGEKLFEELSITGEDVSRTAHPKIGIIRKRPEDFHLIATGITRLLAIADTATVEEIRQELKALVPEYDPSASEEEKKVPSAAVDASIPAGLASDETMAQRAAGGAST